MLLPLLGAAADTDSLYKALEEHGLPAGLIPNSVKNYVLSENGEFKVELEEACYAQIEEPVCYTSFLFADLAWISGSVFESILFYSQRRWTIGLLSILICCDQLSALLFVCWTRMLFCSDV